ncbi:chromate efflux transporter [candidate division WOR-3 bacterium]|uniref:Chromate efflux transporter n=1 Tax=candidate division WOR-3 bacterium TaxID=2052148 RepID=A0A937XFS5_UNCW3|nr:chromate efflux transporter [candidate division WOR-3 bacterium]
MSATEGGAIPKRVSLRDIARVFAKVGTIGFGGGVGMLAIIRQEVVERRRWIDDAQLSVAVAMGQMLPGPFVPNYAEYIGYELRGMRGMVTAVVALLAPCFLLMCGLSYLYFRFGSVPLVTRLFSGVQPVVVGILAWATWSIGKANITNWRAVAIGVIAATALFLKVDVLLVVVGCGVLGMLLARKWSSGQVVKGSSGEPKAEGRRQKEEGRSEEGKPERTEARSQEPKAKRQNGGLPGLLSLSPLLPLLVVAGAVPGVWQKAGELALVFLKVGTVIFGGGFAAIPFLQHEVVDVHRWLSMREFIDGVALGQITPGPVAITAAFIGYKVLGFWGALIAALGTFLPSSLMLWGLIHVYRRVQYNGAVQGFLSGVMPAVTGMILTATVFVGKTAIAGPVQAVVAPLAFCLLLRYRIEPVWLILGGALVGVAV